MRQDDRELAGSATAGQPDACLVFPPLVVGSFGSYYPSLAVLASYLQ
jgi:hypothetical protein